MALSMRLVVFALVLALAFGSAWAVGAAFAPDGDAPAKEGPAGDHTGTGHTIVTSGEGR